ncbi:unnamed protein product [Leptidea sinapis]|uniref:Uncharacterized protein n=1 Tax=Leptidea sinapis TaxID=189913 RepID=A0A5E4QW19_9NEOP|nr:unnamed protein product [Leptidea sinapis]
MLSVIIDTESVQLTPLVRRVHSVQYSVCVCHRVRVATAGGPASRTARLATPDSVWQPGAAGEYDVADGARRRDREPATRNTTTD